MAEIAARLVVLQFPEVPIGAVLETGMFGYSGEGPLQGLPMIAGTDASPPAIALASSVARMAFCLDVPADDVRVEIPFPLDQKAGLIHPLVVRIYALKAGAQRTVQASLRFAPPQADSAQPNFSPAREVLDAFAARYPVRLRWDDRRPIGMIMPPQTG